MAKRARVQLYGYYKFKQGEKDPVIDQVHTMMDDAGADYTKTAEASGVSRSAIYNWLEGPTMKPQFCTIAAVAGALGYEMTWQKKNGNNVVNFNKKRVA